MFLKEYPLHDPLYFYIVKPPIATILPYFRFVSSFFSPVFTISNIMVTKCYLSNDFLSVRQEVNMLFTLLLLNQWYKHVNTNFLGLVGAVFRADVIIAQNHVKDCSPLCLSQHPNYNDIAVYKGESISNQPIPFPINQDCHNFHALFQYALYLGTKLHTYRVIL